MQPRCGYFPRGERLQAQANEGQSGNSFRPALFRGSKDIRGAVMSRLLVAAVTGFTLLAACDGTNPFMTATVPDGSTEPLEPGDPNTTVSSKFLWDPARSLTMNSVVYDEATDTLTINNLPFDGPDGKYDHVADAPDGTPIYASRQTSTTGLLKHYALFLRSDYIEATAAGSGDWGDYGNAGANVNRSSFSLPSSGEYVYVGDYAGLRTFDEKGGIELVTGDIELILETAARFKEVINRKGIL
ncbi:MAG: hypothetical protein EBT13_09130 [Rhodobacteraceae bacterium]|nr:hypothetical protein [Paracoccaceae bacterium]